MDSKGLITELPVEAQIKFVKGLFFFSITELRKHKLYRMWRSHITLQELNFRYVALNQRFSTFYGSGFTSFSGLRIAVGLSLSALRTVMDPFPA